MMRLILSLIICNALIACGSIPKPDSVLYGVNTRASKFRGYNLKEYDDDGKRKKDAKVYERPLSDLKEGWICMDTQSFKNLTVYVRDMRDELKKRCD